MRKKICFVVSTPTTARAFFKDHIERLSEDFDVFIVAKFNHPDKELEGFKIAGYKAINIERQPAILTDIKAVFMLYRYLRKEKFYAVHAMASKPSLVAAIASFFARVPHRIRIFSGQRWCNMQGWKRSFFIAIDKLTVKLNTDLLVDGFSQREYLEQNGILNSNQAQVLANGSHGVDMNRFSASNDIRQKQREALGFTIQVVYVFLGRLRTEKGINELLAAMNKLVLTCPNTVLLLVGMDEENCKKRLGQYENLQDGRNIIFYGLTRTPEQLLQASDVFVMPSYREGLCLSVLEASAVGLPVICSNVYGMKYTMIDNVTGLRCNVRDIDSLYNRMEEMYNNPDMRQEMGRAGHEYVAKYFAKELVEEAWYNYYKEL